MVTNTIIMGSCTKAMKNIVHISVGILFLASPPQSRLYSTLDHCIEWLRQSAMCSSDVTMVTREWVSGITTPVANFDGRRECRNFEKILNWVDEHRVFVPPSKLFPLDDNVNLPSPP
jgi:hypothetical protein